MGGKSIDPVSPNGEKVFDEKVKYLGRREVHTWHTVYKSP